jgi:hypothetical protein
MKLNHATTAAFLSVTFASSSSVALNSSHGELKDYITPLLASNHSYPHRMQQELADPDQCIYYTEAPFHPTFDIATEECASAQTETTAVKRGDNLAITVDTNYSACDSSLFTEACTADNCKLDSR